MQLFTFEPGDGVSYRVLFGRLPSQSPFVPHYVVFGFGEATDALITVVFDTDRISIETFVTRWNTAQWTDMINDPAEMTQAAWTLFAALTGTDTPAPRHWRHDWRAQLPARLLG